MKRVKWEKWVDPLIDKDENNKSVDDNDYLSNEAKQFDVSQQKVIQTPLGIFPVGNACLGSNSFDFWILHTNFDLSPSIIRRIENVVGVETLDVFTRYRARVGISNSGLFSSTKVRNSITKAAIANEYRPNTIISSLLINSYGKIIARQIKKTIKLINSKFEFWFLYVLPNGHYDIIGADSQKNANLQAKIYQQCQESVGGHIINYTDYRSI